MTSNVRLRQFVLRFVLAVLPLTASLAILSMPSAGAEGTCVYAYPQSDTGVTVCTPWQ